MYALDYSPDGRLLFAGNADGTSQIWDVAITGHHVLIDDARVNVAAFSPDGRYVRPRRKGIRPSCGTSRPAPSLRRSRVPVARRRRTSRATDD
jgi:WD40 repeat protein